MINLHEKILAQNIEQYMFNSHLSEQEKIIQYTLSYLNELKDLFNKLGDDTYITTISTLYMPQNARASRFTVVDLENLEAQIISGECRFEELPRFIIFKTKETLESCSVQYIKNAINEESEFLNVNYKANESYAKLYLTYGLILFQTNGSFRNTSEVLFSLNLIRLKLIRNLQEITPELAFEINPNDTQRYEEILQKPKQLRCRFFIKSILNYKDTCQELDTLQSFFKEKIEITNTCLNFLKQLYNGGAYWHKFNETLNVLEKEFDLVSLYHAEDDLKDITQKLADEPTKWQRYLDLLERLENILNGSKVKLLKSNYFIRTALHSLKIKRKLKKIKKQYVNTNLLPQYEDMAQHLDKIKSFLSKQDILRKRWQKLVEYKGKVKEEIKYVRLIILTWIKYKKIIARRSYQENKEGLHYLFKTILLARIIPVTSAFLLLFMLFKPLSKIEFSQGKRIELPYLELVEENVSNWIKTIKEWLGISDEEYKKETFEVKLKKGKAYKKEYSQGGSPERFTPLPGGVKEKVALGEASTSVMIIDSIYKAEASAVIKIHIDAENEDIKYGKTLQSITWYAKDQIEMPLFLALEGKPDLATLKFYNEQDAEVFPDIEIENEEVAGWRLIFKQPFTGNVKYEIREAKNLINLDPDDYLERIEIGNLPRDFRRFLDKIKTSKMSKNEQSLALTDKLSTYLRYDKSEKMRKFIINRPKAIPFVEFILKYARAGDCDTVNFVNTILHITELGIPAVMISGISTGYEPEISTQNGHAETITFVDGKWQARNATPYQELEDLKKKEKISVIKNSEDETYLMSLLNERSYLHDKDPEVKKAVIKKLGEENSIVAKEYFLSKVDKKSKNYEKNEELRATYYEALGKYRGKSIVTLFKAALSKKTKEGKDSDAYEKSGKVRAKIIQAWSRMTPQDALKFLPTLIDRETENFDGTIEAREATVIALDEIADARILPLLHSMLENDSERFEHSDKVVLSIVKLIRKFGDKSSFDILKSVLDMNSPNYRDNQDVKRHSIHAIVKADSKKAVPIIISILDKNSPRFDNNGNVILAAIYALGSSKDMRAWPILNKIFDPNFKYYKDTSTRYRMLPAGVLNGQNEYIKCNINYFIKTFVVEALNVISSLKAIPIFDQRVRHYINYSKNEDFMKEHMVGELRLNRYGQITPFISNFINKYSSFYNNRGLLRAEVIRYYKDNNYKNKSAINLILAKINRNSLQYDRYFRVRKEAIDFLGLLRITKPVPLLIKYLDSSYEIYDYVRVSTAENLGYIGDRRAVLPLIESLKADKEKAAEVRSKAAEALGKLKAFKAIWSLIEKASPSEARESEEETKIRENAVWALGEIGTTEALDRLLNHLDPDFEKNSKVRIKAINALAKHKYKKAIPLLIKELTAENKQIQGAVADALVSINDKSIIPQLITLWLKIENKKNAFHIAKTINYINQKLLTDELKNSVEVLFNKYFIDCSNIKIPLSSDYEGEFMRDLLIFADSLGLINREWITKYLIELNKISICDEWVGRRKIIHAAVMEIGMNKSPDLIKKYLIKKINDQQVIRWFWEPHGLDIEGEYFEIIDKLGKVAEPFLKQLESIAKNANDVVKARKAQASIQNILNEIFKNIKPENILKEPEKSVRQKFSYYAKLYNDLKRKGYRISVEKILKMLDRFKSVDLKNRIVKEFLKDNQDEFEVLQITTRGTELINEEELSKKYFRIFRENITKFNDKELAKTVVFLLPYNSHSKQQRKLLIKQLKENSEYLSPGRFSEAEKEVIRVHITNYFRNKLSTNSEAFTGKQVYEQGPRIILKTKKDVDKYFNILQSKGKDNNIFKYPNLVFKGGEQIAKYYLKKYFKLPYWIKNKVKSLAVDLDKEKLSKEDRGILEFYEVNILGEPLIPKIIEYKLKYDERGKVKKPW